MALRWPLEAVHAAIRVNDGVDPADLHVVQTKRLGIISRRMHDQPWQILITFTCVITMPIDRLLRLLIKSEADDPDAAEFFRESPLIYSCVMMRDPRNPIVTCLKEIVQQMSVGSDCLWLPQYWIRIETARIGGAHPTAFAREWSRRALQLQMHCAPGLWRSVLCVNLSVALLTQHFVRGCAPCRLVLG